jgi:zinc/manganese transport system substrate-binding protein
MRTTPTFGLPRPARWATLPAALMGLMLALVLTACGSTTDSTTADTTATTAAPAAPDVPVIVATTSILGDITANVVGDLATVEVIMPLNADPHDFEPSARDAALLRDADLIVANGLLLEEGLLGTIESASADGTPVIEVADLVDPIPFVGGHSHSHGGDKDDDHDHDHDKDDDHDHDKDGDHDHDKDGDHDHGDLDPHVWQDPARMAVAAAAIGDAVVAATDLEPTQVAAQTEAYVAELEALNEELDALFATIPPERRVLVTNHDAFGYLADRFGFEIVGTIFPTGSELAEPSAASLVALVALIDELSVPAIFTENIASTDLADTLANETTSDVAVVQLFSDSLGEAGSGAGTYTDMMRTNAERITDALR